MSRIRSDFPEPYERSADGPQGKTRIYSHPVYLPLTGFRLKDYRGGS